MLNAAESEPLHSQDLISNSPDCLTHNSYNVGPDKLSLDQLTIPYLVSFIILITFQCDIVTIL